MKRKYFLFRKEDLSLLSSSSSDTGKGLSVFGVNADAMSYITAIQGGVVMYFNNATPYEQSALTDGESFEKAEVTVNCEEGKEVDLIESIMKFLGSDNSDTIMRFDSVAQRSDIKEVKTSLSIGATIKSHPINRVTGETSFQSDNSFTPSSGNVINDIDFYTASNKPILDLEAENATYNASSPFELTAWANSGTGGSDYDVNAAGSVGTDIVNVSAGSATGLSKDSARFTLDSYTVLSNTLTVKDDYTMYVVYSPNVGVTAETHGVLYGSTSGNSMGLNVVNEDATKSSSQLSTFGVRHESSVATPAIARTDTTEFNTVSYTYPVLDSDNPDYQQCYVFVIRRDAYNNLFMYNYNGDVVAAIKENYDQKLSSLGTLPGDTTGNFVLDQIGSAGGNTQSSFKGRLARLGVIEKDIGDAQCRKLAEDLFNLYKF